MLKLCESFSLPWCQCLGITSCAVFWAEFTTRGPVLCGVQIIGGLGADGKVQAYACSLKGKILFRSILVWMFEVNHSKGQLRKGIPIFFQRSVLVAFVNMIERRGNFLHIQEPVIHPDRSSTTTGRVKRVQSQK